MEWQTFLDTYTAVIHNSKTLSNVEKFTYLRSYIEKDALNAISGISLTNDNYDKAWELLQERFGNTQVIITSHMNELLKMRKITSEKDLQGMRKLYDDVENHVRCLQSLGVHGGQYGPLLSPVIMDDRLPIQFKLTVSRHLKTDLWDLTKLLELIRDEIRARENVSAIEGSTREDEGKNSSNVREYIEKPHTDAVLTSQSTPKSRCIFCKAFHWSDKCKVISDIEARKEFLRKGKRCFLCMREGHFANSCQKTKPCFYCKKFHHSAICNERNKNEDSPQTAATHYVQTESAPVLLQTADIMLFNGKNKLKVKALFDNGSQRSYITTRASKCLKLPCESSDTISINTFGSTTSKVQTINKVKFSAKTKNDEIITLEASTIANICSPLKNQPVILAKEKFKHLKGLNLADSGKGGEIDLLLGSDVYWDLMTGNVSQGLPGEVVGVETKFGWVLNGPVIGDSSSTWVNVVNSTHVVFATADQCLEESVKRFWDNESIGIKEKEVSVYDKFSETIHMNKEHRYEVRLPFKEDHPQIHDNFELCKNRLLRLHKRLKENPELFKNYDQIFQEQRKLGITEEVTDSGKIGETHYLPHQPVIRQDKETSKVRIVFDASAKSMGPSLNDCLYKGPQLTPLIYDILLRFRSYAVALTADIEKAFLQISIDDTDRNYLRFLWFEDVFSNEPRIVRNRFARVIFGVTSSPFLLNGTVRKHAKSYEYGEEFIAAVINSFFVDDYTGGEADFEKALILYRKLKVRFLEGQFHLRKWRTNNTKLRHILNDNESQCENNETSPQKILGILWDEGKDVFVYDFEDIVAEAKKLQPTKRNILRVLAMFYDPLGVTQPIVMSFKILFQNICRVKCGWDDELCDDFCRRWSEILTQLGDLGKFEITRHFEQVDEDDVIISRELHGFSDASEKAYGACIFVRTLHKSGKVNVVLLTAKSRVAPMKETTIPRLELLGNLLLSRLVVSVKEALSSVEFDGEFLWTDSMVSLSWIKAHDKEFKTFVENRVR